MQRQRSFVSLPQLDRFLYDGEPLPKNALLLTFDDAYPSVYQKAYPQLRERGIPATVFVITELVGTSEPYWWDEIPYYLPDEHSPAEKHAMVWEAKSWKNAERLAYLEELRHRSTKAPLRREQLTWENLAEMCEHRITIANHTHDHPMLDRLSDVQARQTIRTAKEELDQRGFDGRYFAYPNGNSSRDTINALKEEGIRLAFLFDHQLTSVGTDPLKISRLSMNTANPIWKTRFILSGHHSRYLNIRKRLWS